jgi:hypothetical protein
MEKTNNTNRTFRPTCYCTVMVVTDTLGRKRHRDRRYDVLVNVASGVDLGPNSLVVLGNVGVVAAGACTVTR